jgi:hypothetical protein
MPERFNIYCDESCHLEHDQRKVMVLGALWCPTLAAHDIALRLREIKARHGLKPGVELKWTKVSGSKKQLYLDVLDYFFSCDDLHFRAVLVPDKSALRHSAFGQTHDDWYYKMYFTLLRTILNAGSCFRIYMDYKDTWGRVKVKKLGQVLASSLYDFPREIVERVQVTRSHEVEQLQLCDLLIGAVAYVNRGLAGNPGKVAFVEQMKQQSGFSLERTTLLGERKVNMLRWQAAEVDE